MVTRIYKGDGEVEVAEGIKCSVRNLYLAIRIHHGCSTPRCKCCKRRLGIELKKLTNKFAQRDIFE